MHTTEIFQLQISFFSKIKTGGSWLFVFLFILKYGKNIMYPSFFTIATISQKLETLSHGKPKWL